MRNFVIKNTVFVLFMFMGTFSIANAGAVRIPSVSQHSPVHEMKFDGVWVGPGNVTLIKQLEGYVILQGKDKASTWWARGVISGNKLTCRGSGVGNGSQFVYESSIVFENGTLKDSWKAIFPEGKELQGDDVLVRVEVEQTAKAPQAAR